jgi:hypothetical protein
LSIERNSLTPVAGDIIKVQHGHKNMGWQSKTTLDYIWPVNQLFDFQNTLEWFWMKNQIPLRLKEKDFIKCYSNHWESTPSWHRFHRQWKTPPNYCCSKHIFMILCYLPI